MNSEIVFQLPSLDAESIGAAVARVATGMARDPEFLAAMTGGTLLPVLVMTMARRRLPFVPWLILALMGEGIGLMAWRSYQNLEIIARAAAERDA